MRVEEVDGHGGAVDLWGKEATAMVTESCRACNRFSRQEPFTEEMREDVRAPGEETLWWERWKVQQRIGKDKELERFSRG